MGYESALYLCEVSLPSEHLEGIRRLKDPQTLASEVPEIAF